MRGRAITTALLFAAAPLAGQTLQDYCNGTIPVTVGRWAAYKFTGGRSAGTTMRMAIVSSEKVGDSTFYWYELQMHSMRGNKPNNTIMQMLVAGLASPRVSIKGLIMKDNDHPATRAPEMMIGMMSRAFTSGMGQYLEQRCKNGNITIVGMESVTVPAGTFQAMHFKDNEGGEGWVSKEMGLFAVVKVIGKDGTVMELTDRGSDAKSAITETPQSMMH
jgi:hypothetical protein